MLGLLGAINYFCNVKKIVISDDRVKFNDYWNVDQDYPAIKLHPAVLTKFKILQIDHCRKVCNQFTLRLQLLLFSFKGLKQLRSSASD